MGRDVDAMLASALEEDKADLGSTGPKLPLDDSQHHGIGWHMGQEQSDLLVVCLG
jgi:hypothetical protein